MRILKIKQTKLGQISKAVNLSADYVDNYEKHMEFLGGFNGAFGFCDNMKYDSYNQYNISGDKIIEIGFESIATLEKWIDWVMGLLNAEGIAEADYHSMWKTMDVIEEIRHFCK